MTEAQRPHRLWLVLSQIYLLHVGPAPDRARRVRSPSKFAFCVAVGVCLAPRVSPAEPAPAPGFDTCGYPEWHAPDAEMFQGGLRHTGIRWALDVQVTPELYIGTEDGQVIALAGRR